MKDQRGVVYLETLVAFLPVFLFFLATLQIADLSAAHIIVRHAATVAARAAVVVMPDDGRYYNDEDNQNVHRFDGLRRSDIELAADRILRANPRLDRGPSNVQVGFRSGQPEPTSAGADPFKGMSRAQLLEAAFSAQTAGAVLDTSNRGNGEQGMREQLDALVTARYRCMISYFCPRDYTLRASASLVYQGARYIYEAWPDSIRSDGRPDATPAAPVSPATPGAPGNNPGGQTNPANPGGPTNPGTGPITGLPPGSPTPGNPGTGGPTTPGSSPPSTPTNPGPVANNPPPASPTNPGPVASNPTPTSASAPTSSSRPGSSNTPGSSSSPTPGSSASNANGTPGSNPSASAIVAGNTPGSNANNASASRPNGTTRPGNNTAPGSSTSGASNASSSTSGNNTATDIVASAPTNSNSPVVGTSRPGQSGNTAANGDRTAADGSRADGANQAANHVSATSPTATGPNDRANIETGASPSPNGRDTAPTRGPPSSNQDTQNVIAGAVAENESTGPSLPGAHSNNQSSSSIVASGPHAQPNRSNPAAANSGRTGPRSEAALRAALPPSLRNVPIVRDPSLPGSTVRVQYTHDARGVITGIELRIGDGARARHVSDHSRTVQAMQRYQGLAGRARILLAQLRAWIAGHPDIRPGSLAWETQREVEKLSAIVNDRLTRLRTTPLDDAARSELEQELSEYEQQLADYEAALASIADEAGRGYVAAASSGVPRRAQAAPTPELVLPTDRNPALFNTAPNPGELFLDRSGANTGAITRRTVADANRSSPNSNSRNGIFVQGPNGTFIRYLPLEYPAGRTRFQSARNARAQGIVALIDTSYLDQNLGVEASGHIANRLTDQDRGHLLANILGGANIRENLFPLWYFRNRGFMSQMEVALENDIRTHGRRVWIQVDTIYGPRGVPLGLVVRVDDANGTNPPDPLSTTASVHWFPNYDVLGN